MDWGSDTVRINYFKPLGPRFERMKGCRDSQILHVQAYVSCLRAKDRFIVHGGREIECWRRNSDPLSAIPTSY